MGTIAMISKMQVKENTRRPKFYFGWANRITLLLIFSVSLFACMAQNSAVKPMDSPTDSVLPAVKADKTPPDSEDDCIPPLEDIFYSTDLNPSKPVPGKDLIVAPPLPWEMVSSLPERWIGWGGQFSRTINGHVEIWIVNDADWDIDPDNAARVFVFLIYRPDTGEWKKVSAMISDSNISVGKLFTAEDGTLWGSSGFGLAPFAGDEAKSPLAKYNEQTEKFEFVEEAGDIPAGRTDPNGILASPYWNITLQDADGVFWILVHKDGIYRFDPITYQSEKYAETPNTIFGDTAISANGDIYYLNSGVDLISLQRINDLPIFRFNTKSKVTEQIGISLEPWPKYFVGMLVDHKDRLWLGGMGFREPDGNWYQIQRSPVFIVNTAEDNSSYRWLPPSLLMESSDGRLWFNSLNGTTWLDLDNKKWCWFTTYKSNIVEDSDHNLWMIADGKLYKNPLDK
jgi:hypothetical protein